ncbi:hypothetical protein [Nocardia sp. NPDC049707]|uniref:hypothetical protein n=1 Tax=Nocardia sp. NPDC049707 TaxID=3154735 RepID=UPI00344911D4
MANNEVAEGDTRQRKAIGLVRDELSGLAAPQHAVTIQRHARTLGYQYIYTVRPPHDTPDPIGYALSIATGLDVTAIVVYDLACVDSQPARVCEDFDLETVCPATTWARVCEDFDLETVCPATTWARAQHPTSIGARAQ